MLCSLETTSALLIYIFCPVHCVEKEENIDQTSVSQLNLPLNSAVRDVPVARLLLLRRPHGDQARGGVHEEERPDHRLQGSREVQGLPVRKKKPRD